MSKKRSALTCVFSSTKYTSHVKTPHLHQKIEHHVAKLKTLFIASVIDYDYLLDHDGYLHVFQITSYRKLQIKTKRGTCVEVRNTTNTKENVLRTNINQLWVFFKLCFKSINFIANFFSRTNFNDPPNLHQVVGVVVVIILVFTSLAVAAFLNHDWSVHEAHDEIIRRFRFLRTIFSIFVLSNVLASDGLASFARNFDCGIAMKFSMHDGIVPSFAKMVKIIFFSIKIFNKRDG